ncbi:hypothetical protein L1987_44702 [Smallanthus sonchifolius]|uniref:Uncharacterized protein n=1 Tax=Smallanthus sonchifolius TaxID=185202 RepID=A0ACB9GQ20_9ASTR|nr:hypothetical protein L1987_44702 [Smallanthus sonchifolius]
MWASITYESQYKWTTVAIFVTQSIGVMVGTIAPALRSSALDFKSWSLPIVTLTCIAVALPNIPKETVENLFNSVGEEINESTNGVPVENPPKTLIAADSMYRITQTLLLRYQSNTEPITKKQLFAVLNGMIADIFSACFTDIPRVITMRCHEMVIEKREASVKVAAKLLGKTTKIIERLETCKLPSMDDDKMAYVDEWCIYLKQSIP